MPDTCAKPGSALSDEKSDSYDSDVQRSNPWLSWCLSSFCCDLPIFVIHSAGLGPFHLLSTEEVGSWEAPSSREKWHAKTTVWRE